MQEWIVAGMKENDKILSKSVHLGSQIILIAIRSAYRYITASKIIVTISDRKIPAARHFLPLSLASATSFDMAVWKPAQHRA